MTLLIKALNDSGLKMPIYTYYAGVSGTPTALAAGGDLEVYQIAYNHSNYGGEVGNLDAGVQEEVQRRLVHLLDLQRDRRCSATRWPRPSRPIR